MDIYDLAALEALLIRQIRCQEITAREVIIRDAAIVIIKKYEVESVAIRDAMKVFNIDPKGKVWDDVKSYLGNARYHQAFEIAKLQLFEIDPLKYPLPVVEVLEEEVEEEAVKETKEDVADETSGDKVDNSASIRELVLDRLKIAGSGGSDAATIRSALPQGLHEKTVGMTLYRLSKSGMARREGRTWFYVEPGTPATTKLSSEDAEVELELME